MKNSDIVEFIKIKQDLKINGCSGLSRGGVTHAHQYLIDKNINCDKTQIAVRACSSEEEAFIKKQIHDKYKLFYS